MYQASQLQMDGNIGVRCTIRATPYRWGVTQRASHTTTSRDRQLRDSITRPHSSPSISVSLRRRGYSVLQVAGEWRARRLKDIDHSSAQLALSATPRTGPGRQPSQSSAS
jgi:hypothetical protein